MDDTLEKLFKINDIREEQKTKIHKVGQNVINYYIDYWCRNILDDDRELLYGYDEESGLYIGIDNTSNECWVEEFDNEQYCLDWLNNVDK